MKLVCVYVDENHLKIPAWRAINELWAGEAHLHQVDPENHLGYAEIINSYWKQQESFFVVEPDIVIRGDVVDAVLNCECLYGAFPYPWLTDVGPALGCTWFRTDFLKKYPDAVDKVIRTNISWNQLDVVLMRHVLLREHGEQPHVHLPPVEHLNEAKQLLPEANPEPLMSLPAW